MKNFVIILMILIGSCNFAYATQNKALKIKLANTIYELKYSNCTEQSAICMNEYYKKGEIGFDWTELVTVHYFKNEKDPIGYAEDLAKVSPYSSVIANEETQRAFLHLVIPAKTENGAYIEQNLFRIEKSPYRKGTTSLQYAKKYSVNNDKERKYFKENVNKVQEDYFKYMNLVNIPDIYLKPIQ